MIQRHDSIVVQTISRVLIPLIQIFAIYVYFHGHYSPGGGFQAGVLIGASIILQLLVGTHKELKQFHVRTEFLLATLGLGIFSGIGGLAILEHGEFLNYGFIRIFGDPAAFRRYLGILLAEAGVLLVVSMTFVVIFHVLAFLPAKENKTS